MMKSLWARFFSDGVSAKATIIKNTFWLFSGQMVGRLIRAGIVIYGARLLGATHWGAFSYALGFVTFLTVFSDIGINGLITKEASRNKDLKDQYVSTAFVLKLGLITATLALIFVFFPRFSHLEEATRLMPILIFVFAFDTIRDLAATISRSLEKMHLEATTNVLTNLAIVILGAGALFLHPTAMALALAYAAGSGIGMLASFYVLRGHFGNLFTNFRRDLLRPIIVTAWPFGLLAMLGALMLNTDVIMIGALSSAAQVGYYSVAQKIVQLLYVLPTFFATSIFPMMSRLTSQNREAAAKVLGKSIALVTLLAIPITVFGVWFAPFIIQLLFGAQYAASVGSFRVLMLTVLIVYPSMMVGNAAFAFDEQRNFIPFVLTAALSNVFLNALLIPPFGIVGASFATIIAQLTSNIFIWRRMKRVSGFVVWPYLKSYLGGK